MASGVSVDVYWLPYCSAFPLNHASPLVCMKARVGSSTPTTAYLRT